MSCKIDEKYEYVLKATTLPDRIPVADKPLSLGGKIEYLSLQQFEEKFKCVYREGISIDANTKIIPIKNRTKITSLKTREQIEKTKAIIKNPSITSQHLVFCKMGDLGYGIFTSKDIQKDTILAIYSGTISNEENINKYYKNQQGDESFGYEDTKMVVCPFYHRGIASFMQHLPYIPPSYYTAEDYRNVEKPYANVDEIKLKYELYGTEFFKPLSRKCIARQNVRAGFLTIDNIPVIIMSANANIKANEQLGFDYSSQYWRSRKITPNFFLKDGSIVKGNLYKRTHGDLFFGRELFELNPKLKNLFIKDSDRWLKEESKNKNEYPPLQDYKFTIPSENIKSCCETNTFRFTEMLIMLGEANAIHLEIPSSEFIKALGGKVMENYSN